MKLLIVDDHELVRDGLRACLQEDDGFCVVGEASDGATAVKLAGELKPDVVIMDIAMACLNGIEATRQITADATSSTRVICLSMHSDREFIAEAFRAGASGYMLKSSAFQELVHALREVEAGRKYVSPMITEVVVDNYVRRTAEPGVTPFSVLTSRERQILQLLAEGQSAKEIAATLSISHKTVHAFRLQIMEKIGVESLPELTKYAIRHGLTNVY